MQVLCLLFTVLLNVAIYSSLRTYLNHSETKGFSQPTCDVQSWFHGHFTVALPLSINWQRGPVGRRETEARWKRGWLPSWLSDALRSTPPLSADWWRGHSGGKRDKEAAAILSFALCATLSAGAFPSQQQEPRAPRDPEFCRATILFGGGGRLLISQILQFPPHTIYRWDLDLGSMLCKRVLLWVVLDIRYNLSDTNVLLCLAADPLPSYKFPHNFNLSLSIASCPSNVTII